MNRRKKVWFLTIFSLLVVGIAAVATPVWMAAGELPNEIFITGNSQQTLDVNLPFSIRVRTDDEAQDVLKFNGNSLKDQDTYNLDEPLTISPEKTGEVDVSLDLLGLIPIKNIKVTVAEEKYLVPGGQSIGVMLYTKGALVVGSMDVYVAGGEKINPAKEAGLEAGDVIEKLNGEEIRDANHLMELINDMTGDTVELQVRRGEDTLNIQIHPVKDVEDGKLKLGVWVRDSTAGVGTLTFYDPETNKLAGLGHAISDVDTGEELTVKEGEIIESDIVEIVKGEIGDPGELKGSFNIQNELLGDIEKNTPYGIYGTAEEPVTNDKYSTPLLAGTREEVHTGKASILCTLDDSGMQEFECEIIKVTKQDAPDQKSFVIQVTDSELLSLTGGIVQGMSGSPVIQDGKLIGAVTHVFVNDPTKGYGLYVDWMLNECYN